MKQDLSSLDVCIKCLYALAGPCKTVELVVVQKRTFKYARSVGC